MHILSLVTDNPGELDSTKSLLSTLLDLRTSQRQQQTLGELDSTIAVFGSFAGPIAYSMFCIITDKQFFDLNKCDETKNGSLHYNVLCENGGEWGF